MATQRVSPFSNDVLTFPDPPRAYVVETTAGERRHLGAGPPAFTVRVPDFDAWRRLVRGGTYALATAIVRGRVRVEGDFLAAVRWWSSHRPARAGRSRALAGLLRIEAWWQARSRARRNVEFHYDRSNAFYRLFLDSRMVYSCAYFRNGTATLDEAQLAKLDLICRKLDVAPGQSLLDAGCGWGGLVVHAAERYGARALGCTLSAGQFAYVSDAIRARRLRGRVMVANCDYRDVRGRFDRIASVGMYEHVGRRRLGRYFETLAARLEPDGLLLNHGIARPAPVHDDGETAFVRAHVFPGGELPYLDEVVRAAERAGFEVIDIQNLRPHYALTCEAWVRRLQANREACLELVDAQTYRTWLLYLAAAAVNFERGETELYQTLLGKRRPGARRHLTRERMLPVPL
jgi:cyclopropane-fatty-acyl-phospholipid synthase